MLIRWQNNENHIFEISDLKLLYGMVYIDIQSSVIADKQAIHMVIVQFSSVKYANELSPLCKNTFFTITLEVLI